MRHFYFIAALIILLGACKKESPNPILSFSSEERNWFGYEVGQSLKFKNSSGDSIVYTVTGVRNGFRTEYKDPFTQQTEVAQTEYYAVDLRANTDSMFIYFYKEFQYNSDPNKMRQTIGWNKIIGQSVKLEAIQNQVPFTTRIINNVTYHKVTQASPITQTFYPWTIWTSASYDQQFGFIELIDTNGISWLRY